MRVLRGQLAAGFTFLYRLGSIRKLTCNVFRLRCKRPQLRKSEWPDRAVSCYCRGRPHKASLSVSRSQCHRVTSGRQPTPTKPRNDTIEKDNNGTYIGSPPLPRGHPSGPAALKPCLRIQNWKHAGPRPGSVAAAREITDNQPCQAG